MIKSIFLLLLMLVSLNFVIADIQLVCLNKGETIEFSLCNPKIEDRYCDSSGGCSFCVDEISPGVFCQQHINKCNSLGLVCNKIDFEPEEVIIKDENKETTKKSEIQITSVKDSGITTGGAVTTVISPINDQLESNKESKKYPVILWVLFILSFIEFFVLGFLFYYSQHKIKK
jgi:hypothetical protein